MSREIIREAYSADRTALVDSSSSFRIFKPAVACFLCVSVPTFGLSAAFIRARPITFLPAVLFIRWSEINCVGLGARL